MQLEPISLQPDDALVPATEQRTIRLYRWVEFLSAAMLALATVATAWCGYQSALWGGEQNSYVANVTAANVKVAKFTSTETQKLSLHVGLFSQWAAAVSTNNQVLADFIFQRFPEPLKAASSAWLATTPLANPNAPSSPFVMPNYVLAESGEIARWEAISAAEATAANNASDISNRYLLFTIIFASVLFFGGISGKFRWQVLDIAVLILGALAFIVGLLILFSTPVIYQKF